MFAFIRATVIQRPGSPVPGVGVPIEAVPPPLFGKVEEVVDQRAADFASPLRDAREHQIENTRPGEGSHVLRHIDLIEVDIAGKEAPP
jgi:hypothetical protein